MMRKVALFVAMALGAEAFMPMPSALAPRTSMLPAAASRPAALSPLSQLSMVDIKVSVNDGEPIESAIRRFKMACSKSGHLMELKRRKTFETNNEKMIRKDKESMRNRSMAKRKQREANF
ncbi:hypothetical protein T484DRAFT_1929240 [Baffinella frigidus]|nr:hypothetical protein T484DRAFT_1929240 [Cryptophyta sp. CCMP2293]